jgi:PAS domain S-box-containing protein
MDILWEAKLADIKTPIIFMSEEGELRHDLSAMRAGAVDFIEKSQITSRLLARSIRYAVQRKRSEEDLRKHIIFLEHLVEARTRELLDEQNRLRALVDSIVDEVWFCDATGKIQLANTAATDALGFENEQDLLSTISELMPKLQIHVPDGRAKSRSESPILKSVRGEVIQNEEETIRHPKTGELHHKHVSSAPVKNESGEIIGAVAIIRDITERKRMEIALREGAQLLQSILEALPVGVWITDRDGKIIKGNPAGREIWGGARYVGVDRYHEYKCWWADSGEPIRPEESALARAVMRGETSLNEEIEIEGFDGLRKIILNSALPVCDSEQQILAAIGVSQDITARKKAEREREKLIAKLRESLANIRTLKGLLPVCAWCKKIRDDQGYWNQLESYITSHFEVGITHGICPECAEKLSHELHGMAHCKPKV